VLAQLDAVHHRHAPVGQDQVRMPPAGRFKGTLAVVRAQYTIAVKLEYDVQGSRGERIVIHDQ
jgi:hypothetical protein